MYNLTVVSETREVGLLPSHFCIRSSPVSLFLIPPRQVAQLCVHGKLERQPSNLKALALGVFRQQSSQHSSWLLLSSC